MLLEQEVHAAGFNGNAGGIRHCAADCQQDVCCVLCCAVCCTQEVQAAGNNQDFAMLGADAAVLQVANRMCVRCVLHQAHMQLHSNPDVRAAAVAPQLLQPLPQLNTSLLAETRDCSKASQLHAAQERPAALETGAAMLQAANSTLAAQLQLNDETSDSARRRCRCHPH
jgi:hypothetical protein